MALAPASSSSSSSSGATTQLSYVERTTNLQVSATVEASADTVVTAAALVLDGATRICVEFYSPYVQNGASAAAELYIALFDGSTPLGRLALVGLSGVGAPVHVFRFLTPTAASHTYSVRAYRNAVDGFVWGLAGGATTAMPTYIRVTTA